MSENPEKIIFDPDELGHLNPSPTTCDITKVGGLITFAVSEPVPENVSYIPRITRPNLSTTTNGDAPKL